MSLRGHGATVLVAALSAAFGVGVLAAIEVLISAVSAEPGVGDNANVRLVLTVAAMAFIAIAVYVAAVVTTNTVSTIVAGRTREIALYRLLGTTAASRRRALAAEGLAAGGLGALLGAGSGIGLVAAATGIAVSARVMPEADYAFVAPAMALPVLGVALVTWLAAWVGSARVLRVPPITALGAAVPDSAEAIAGRGGRRVGAAALFWTGTAILALSAVAGLLSPVALLPAVLGGMLSFTGVVLGAPYLIPRALRLVGLLLGRGAAGRLAAANAVRDPQRSSRATIGLVIGVALVTMFVVAASTAERSLRLAAEEQFGSVEPMQGTLSALMGVFGFLVGYSAVIAAVGLVNALTVSVLQRTRELGLLRALGLTRGQVRATVLGEAAQLTLTALALGLALGVGYGWVAATSLLGAIAGPQPPILPWWLPVAALVLGAVLTAAASTLPAARAARLAPVEALAR